MKNYFQNDPEAFEEGLAELKIYVDKHGEITFNCSWEPTEAGTDAISSVFFGIAYEDLTDKILNHLKAQCVLEDAEEDFFKIVETIKFFIVSREKELEERKNDDSLVVNPRDITR
jgi:hypothetical protein|tara:strand:- start:1583 stop:1927 length:345 start_codon:yes stop_codon:yes gene_type:complete